MGRGDSKARAAAATLVLDAGAIIALSRRETRARRYILRAQANRARIVVPSVIVAETFRVPTRSRAVDHLLADVDDISPATPSIGRSAGSLLGAAQSDATIDAIVVATAVELQPARILTSDARDFRRLLPRGSMVEILAL